MHQISEFGDDLPLVGIVDPRTGGIVFTLKVAAMWNPQSKDFVVDSLLLCCAH